MFAGSDFFSNIKNTDEVVQTFFCKIEFSLWLDTNEDTCVVGKARSSKMCPLANFLKQGSTTLRLPPNLAVEIGVRTSIIRRSTDKSIEVIDMPKWASRFVQRVDKFPCSAITAVDARLILKRV